MARTDLPLLFEVHEIARLIAWPIRRTRRLLISMRLAKKRGGRWLVSRRELRAELPEVYAELRERYEAQKDEKDQKAA